MVPLLLLDDILDGQLQDVFETRLVYVTVIDLRRGRGLCEMSQRGVRGSIGGRSMDMCCPYGIGRGCRDWEGLDGIGLTPSPEKGDFPSWCVSRRRVQAERPA